MTVPPAADVNAEPADQSARPSRFEFGLTLVTILLSGVILLLHPLNMYQLFGTFNTQWIYTPLLYGMIALLIVWKVLPALWMLLKTGSARLLTMLLVSFALPFVCLILFLITLFLVTPWFPNNPLIITIPVVLFDVWLITQWMSQYRGRPSVSLKRLRVLTFLASLGVPFFLFFVGGNVTIHDELTYGEHHYIVASERLGLDGLPGFIPTLFECNANALDCSDVVEGDAYYDFRKAQADYQLPRFTLSGDDAANLVRVYRDGAESFSYQPGSGEALGRAFTSNRFQLPND